MAHKIRYHGCGHILNTHQLWSAAERNLVRMVNIQPKTNKMKVCNAAGTKVTMSKVNHVLHHQELRGSWRGFLEESSVSVRWNKIELFSLGAQQHIWRIKGEASNPQNTTPTSQARSFLVSNGRGDGPASCRTQDSPLTYILYTCSIPC